MSLGRPPPAPGRQRGPKAVAFLRLGRPLFLVGGVVLYGLGVALAGYAGAELRWLALLWGQVAVTATQLTTHYSNEYYDLPADLANAATTRWSGGSRVLPAGGVAPEVALRAAVGSALAAGAAGLVLALLVRPGPWTLPLLVLALALAWGYSGPPTRLHSRGLGEVFGALLLTGLTPTFGYYLQLGRLEPWILLVLLPLCCLQFAMLVTVSLPDVAGDRAVGKRTLAVILGGGWVARLAAMAVVAAFAAVPLWLAADLPPPAALALAAWSPLAVWQAWRLIRRWDDPGSWGSLGFWGIGLVMGPAASLLVAFAWASLRTTLTGL